MYKIFILKELNLSLWRFLKTAKIHSKYISYYG